MPRRRRNKKVKRYHRSFYSRGDKIKKALGILLLAAVVLGAAWLAAPYVLDWATHTWYTVVRDRELPASSEAVSSQADPLQDLRPPCGSLVPHVQVLPPDHFTPSPHPKSCGLGAPTPPAPPRPRMPPDCSEYMRGAPGLIGKIQEAGKEFWP